MSYRAVVTRTVDTHLVVTAHGQKGSQVVIRDDKQYFGDEEVETVVVDVHKTLIIGETTLAEEWDFRTGLTFGECKEIERVYGAPMATFEELVDDSMAARAALIYVLLKRDRPGLTMADVDRMPRGDWKVETEYTDLAVPEAVPPTEGAAAPELLETDGSSSPDGTTTSPTSPTGLESDPGNGTD